MHIEVIARIGKIVWTRYDRYRAELMFFKGPKKVFWMSKKQGMKLKGYASVMNINSSNNAGRVLGVFDDDRFVWCGCIEEENAEYNNGKEPKNDLPYLSQHFKVKPENIHLQSYCGPPHLDTPAMVTVDKELLDEA